MTFLGHIKYRNDVIHQFCGLRDFKIAENSDILPGKICNTLPIRTFGHATVCQKLIVGKFHAQQLSLNETQTNDFSKIQIFGGRSKLCSQFQKSEFDTRRATDILMTKDFCVKLINHMGVGKAPLPAKLYKSFQMLLCNQTRKQESWSYSNRKGDNFAMPREISVMWIPRNRVQSSQKA